MRFTQLSNITEFHKNKYESKDLFIYFKDGSRIEGNYYYEEDTFRDNKKNIINKELILNWTNKYDWRGRINKY